MSQAGFRDVRAEARRQFNRLRERLLMRSLYPDSIARHMGCFVNAETKVPSLL